MADKYYVVWKGRNPGTYDKWESCEEQVNGYKGAEYKSYKTLEEAVEAYEDGPGTPPKETRTEPIRSSRPLLPDNPERYTDATKEALARVLGK